MEGLAAQPAPAAVCEEEASSFFTLTMPSLFQLWMGINALFELPVILSLVRGSSNVVDGTPWFDRRSFYTTNRAASLTYAAILAVLVVCRGILFHRPELAMMILYGALLHWLELAFFAVVFSARQDRGYDAAADGNPTLVGYALLAVMIFNAAMLTLRFLGVRAALGQERVQAEETRQAQLKEIRRMRAEWKRKNEAAAATAAAAANKKD